MLCYRNLFGEVKTLLDTKCELFVYSLTTRTHLCVHYEFYTSGIKKRENKKSKLMLSFMGNTNCIIVSNSLTTLGLKMLASLAFSLVTNLMPQATWYGVVFQDSPSITFPSGSVILMGLLSFAAFSASRASCSAFSLLYIDRRPSMYCG